ncbi:MAG: 2-hydroxyglutaryl-CoA dehydratase [Candidatus Omnitrophota bacterium]|nr:MAG: 2-hydroxyglutaryl-CoA dehydratase [Candidatus Omnitrophota bacterium]
MITAGIDIGSISTETVILNGDKRILASNILRTGPNSLKVAKKSLEAALAMAELKVEDLDCIVATGYGRINVPFAHKQVTEITCHAKGAYFQFPDTRTVLDVGGQDCKAISLSDKGETLDFAMNDKCAAGTGRFLELMAQALEVTIEELGNLSLKSQNTAIITSFCTVFAESEVVSLIAKGSPRENIARGIHYAITERVMSLLGKIEIMDSVTLTGGVAKNIGFVQALKTKLGQKLNIPQEPQVIGALGAALIAGSIGQEKL